MTVKEQFKLESQIWKQFETLEFKTNLNENIVYFAYDANSAVLKDFAKIAVDYINMQISKY